MDIKVGVSNRHIHLSKEDYIKLFGDMELTKYKDLSQIGEYASNYLVTIKTEKSEINNVRVIGPLREHSQIEISRTDAFKLGINPPVRMSGDFDGALDITLVYQGKSVKINNSCIIARRHIHVGSSEMNKYNFYEGKRISVRVQGDRGGILDDVLVKCKDNYKLEMHIDTDEANAFDIKNGDFVSMIGEDNNG